MDEYTTETLPDEAIIVDTLEEAEEIAGTLYTQVDSGDDVTYIKGKHLVNRTGVYAVIPA